MASRKFGWHSGTLSCQDVKAEGDVYIQDDLVFSDVSAGVLGVTGGLDMTSTTSAVGIDMNSGTFSTADIRLGGGVTLADSSGALTIGGTISTIIASDTLTSQTAENKFLDLTFSTDSTSITGSNIMYSGGYPSSMIKLTGTHSNTTGGLNGVTALITASNDYTTDGHGCVAFKGVVTVADTAVTAGDIAGGQFIAKKSGTGVATAQVAWVGCEAWFYDTGSGEVRTGIGGNFGWHNDSTAASHAAGSVHRGVQIFCDSSGTSAAEETTGLYIWLQSGNLDNGIAIGAANTCTHGLHFLSGTTVTTGIKFGGTVIGGAGNVTCTTGIDIDEVASLTTGITITANCTNALVINATHTGSSVSITNAALTAGDSYSGLRMSITAAAPDNEYGVVAYFDSTLSGTCAGITYNVGSWINLASAYVTGNNLHCVYEGGIYDGGATLTNSRFVGLQLQMILQGAASSLHWFRFNCNDGSSNTVTAIFAAANPGSAAFTSGAGTTSTKNGDIAIADIVGTGVVYVRTYDAAG
jgi:hypothetical protein